MRILAVESSARTVSVAIIDDSRLLSEFYTNTGLTHSQTLMPIIKAALDCAKIDLSSIDSFAVANGPGSYTGIRIGVSAVKGLAHSLNKPCVGVSTLAALSYNLAGQNCIACCVMDARCGQVYTALFECLDGTVKRITEDNAMMISDLEVQLSALEYDLPIVLVGDGSEMCYIILRTKMNKIFLASENLRFQRASSVAMFSMIHDGEIPKTSANDLTSVYLRAPQAERELRKRNEEK
ncbi:MAG: tRNA (adenosine(37)-N6)-threonylcarbamoyltransferase complex dimerization subunit type 1 TsaB [Eubacteriales bacterium]